MKIKFPTKGESCTPKIHNVPKKRSKCSIHCGKKRGVCLDLLARWIFPIPRRTGGSAEKRTPESGNRWKSRPSPTRVKRYSKYVKAVPDRQRLGFTNASGSSSNYPEILFPASGMELRERPLCRSMCNLSEKRETLMLAFKSHTVALLPWRWSIARQNLAPRHLQISHGPAWQTEAAPHNLA